MTSSERSDPSDPGDELSPGDVVGERYRIVGTLGTGGIGVVYRAIQLPLERPVAVKVLHEDMASMPEQRARFEREARALSALTHPNVVSISDYGIDAEHEASSRPFLVMELLEGRTLEEVVRGDPIDPERALAIFRQILCGLASAHEKGIAHRDLKPANVFLTRLSDAREHVKLLDFGLARLVDQEADDEPTLTTRGVVFGTPAYMSPEQAAGTPADLRSDVYSAAVLLFELLAGRRPFVGDTRAELLRAHLSADVPRLASVRPDLRASVDLIDLIDVAMAKDPKERFTDARDMLAALDAIEPPAAWLVPWHEISQAVTQPKGSPPPERAPARGGRRLAIAIAAAVAITAAGAYVWYEPLRPAPEVVRPPPPRELVVARPLGDPFAEPPPAPLRPFLAQVEEGRVFDEREEVAPLFALARAMPDDARPLLLMGHLFVLKSWFTQAILRYERAFERDPAARGDPRMLDNLVMMAARESVEEPAGRAIESIYGAEALPALDAAIEALEDDPITQIRLVRLRERIASAR